MSAEMPDALPVRPIDWPKRGLDTLAVLWIAALAVVGISNAWGPENWWFGATNLYLPQWIYALPAVVLLPVYAIYYPRHLAVPIACVLYVAWPLMGFTWTFPRAASGAVQLRVMTFNAKEGEFGADRVIREIRKANPDIIQFQDSTGLMNTPVANALAGYTVRVAGQHIVASKYPISKITRCNISNTRWGYRVTRVWMRVGKQGVVIYNVHLISPREGLVGVRHERTHAIVDNTAGRLSQARRLAGYLSNERGPLIVTGDLNCPIQGLVCRCLTGIGLRDAWCEAGHGYGYTYGRYTKVGMPYVRIDHILVSRHWSVTRCWTGGSDASEHVPVCAVLALTGST